MIKRIIDFLLYPFRRYLKLVEEVDKKLEDESQKALDDGDTELYQILIQMRLELLEGRGG